MEAPAEINILKRARHADASRDPSKAIAIFLLVFSPAASFQAFDLGCLSAMRTFGQVSLSPVFLKGLSHFNQQKIRAPTMQVVSPFDPAKKDDIGDADDNKNTTLELNRANVELVLDEMRPYLVADGGDVAVKEIQNGIVKLELQGACVSCASSTMTMKMGLEKGLRERIPDVIAVEQVAPDGPPLSEEGIEGVLDEVRPFMKMARSSVDLLELKTDSFQPTVKLAITGSGATINSVRIEIAARLKRKFPTLGNIVWAPRDA